MRGLTASTPGLWDKRRVAEYLGISTKSVERAVRDQGLPALRVTARCIRFDPTQVENWLKRKRRVRPGK